MVHISTLSTLLGEETRSSGTWKLYAFVMHLPSAPGKIKETSISLAAKNDAFVGASEIRKQAFSRSAPGRKKELGHWSQITYGLEVGAIVKVYGYRSGGHGQRAHIVNQLIRIRPDASVLKLTLPLSSDPDASHSEAYILGRFDQITPSDAEGYGLKLDIRRRKLMEAAHRDVLRVQVLEEGTELSDVFEAKTLVDEDGNEKRILTGRKRRQLE